MEVVVKRVKVTNVTTLVLRAFCDQVAHWHLLLNTFHERLHKIYVGMQLNQWNLTRHLEHF
jgi:hypothetical protein